MNSATGRYKEAISDLIKANEAKDSIFDETKSRQIAQLEIEFESEKKENQISLLNQKAILESTKLKQLDFVKNVTIGGVILLSLTGQNPHLLSIAVSSMARNLYYLRGNLI